MKTKNTADKPAKDDGEPRNVAVEVLKNRTLIGKAICAAGPCSFPLTATEAKQLEGLGLVRITGLHPATAE